MAPTIDLYYMPESPPCRMVEMVASLIGIKLNKHYINLFTKEQLKEDYVKLNPLHKVPFIVDGELKMNESRAIMTYLVDKYGASDALYPKDPDQRARVNELLYYDVGTLYPASGKLFSPLLFGDATAALDPESEKAFKESLNYLDQRLADNGGKRYMLGNELTVADIALSTTVAFGVFGCEYNIDMFSNLVNYLERVRAAIPAYANINDAALENTKKYIHGRRPASK